MTFWIQQLSRRGRKHATHAACVEADDPERSPHPVARLGAAISEFSLVLDEKRKQEFRNARNAKYVPHSGSDIIKITEEINREGRRRHRTWRPDGTRLGAFLSKLQVFAAVGDVIVGGAQDVVISGVWGALRLSLLVSCAVCRKDNAVGLGRPVLTSPGCCGSFVIFREDSCLVLEVRNLMVNTSGFRQSLPSIQGAAGVSL